MFFPRLVFFVFNCMYVCVVPGYSCCYSQSLPMKIESDPWHNVFAKKIALRKIASMPWMRLALVGICSKKRGTTNSNNSRNTTPRTVATIRRNRPAIRWTCGSRCNAGSTRNSNCLIIRNCRRNASVCWNRLAFNGKCVPTVRSCRPRVNDKMCGLWRKEQLVKAGW